MSNYRLSKGTTEHYTSLEELRAAWGKKPFVKRTKDEAKLKSQREKFCNKHLCKACKQPMEYVGGNVMTCTNPECKGVKIEHKDKEGNVYYTYMTSYDLLRPLGAEIASNIF